jgi:hypothetical protein
VCAKYAKDYCTLGFSCPGFGQTGRECENKMEGRSNVKKVSVIKTNKMVAHLQMVCHNLALPFTSLKIYLKAKEKLWKLKYFTMQKYNLPKNL